MLAADLTRIQVKVVGEDGKPIDRANVRIAFKDGRSLIKFTRTDRSWEMKTSQEGIANVPALPKGEILIQVTADWHQSFGKVFDIQEDERTVEVVLKEPQEQYSAHPDNDPTGGK